jgi:hypothetical protein
MSPRGADPSAGEKVARADIEGKLREIRQEIEGVEEAAKPYALSAAVALAVVVLAAAYLLGRRRGKRRTTIVEVRRV